MTMKDLPAAIAAAERFATVAKEALKAHEEDRRWYAEWNRKRERGEHMNVPNNTRASIKRAAARRASMDLTRALADFRRYE